MNPLRHEEFLEIFLTGPTVMAPMQLKEMLKFNNWYLNVTKLAKQRSNYLNKKQAEAAAESSKQTKGKLNKKV